MSLLDSRLDEWATERVALCFTRPGAFNARQDLDIDPEFQESIATKGVLSPPWVTEDEQGIAGARRTEAARRAGLKMMCVRVFTGVSLGEIVSLGLLENVARKGLSYYEVYLGLKRLRDACPNMKQKEIAQGSGMSEGMLSQYYKLDKFCVEGMEAFKAGLGVTLAYKVATSEDQHATLARFKNGEGRDSVPHKPRKIKTIPVAPIDLAKRITLPPVGKAAVVIAAGKDAEISLDDALQAVVEAARQIKAAQAKGISAATAARYFKDIAAAG